MRGTRAVGRCPCRGSTGALAARYGESVKNISVAAVVTLLALVPCACSSSGTTESASTEGGDASADAAAAKDAATPADASGTDAGGGGACNALVNGAPEATANTVKGPAPTATGGTIVDGTYFQTEFTVYDPAGTASAPSPSGLKITLAIKGDLMESIQTLPDGSTDTFAETFVTSGTALDRTLTCPKKTPDLKAVYSVAGSKLTIYETDPKSKLVAGSVFVKQ